MNRPIVSIVIRVGICFSLLLTARAVDSAEDILAASGVKGGLVVHLGCGDGQVTASLMEGLKEGDRLPYADNMVNLILADQGTDFPRREILRVLRPLGVAYVKTDGRWTKKVKPWPEGMDEWTHFLHAPDGNAVSRDQYVGNPEVLRWVAPP